MTDPGTEPANLDPHGRPLGGQLERDARLLAAAQSIDLTAGHRDNITRAYWYTRTSEAYEQLREYGRDDDVNVSYVEPCTISCDCGERTVPWPREAITVECEKCGIKHAIAPLAESRQSTIDYLNEVCAENRKLKEQVDAQKQTLDLVRTQNDAVVEQVDAALGHRYHRPGVHYSVPHVAEKAAAELKELQARIDDPCDECRRLGRRCTEARKRARTAESERDRIKAVVQDVLKTLDHHAVCCFEFCAGPDEPFEGMKTCRVCSSIQDLRAALQGDQPTAGANRYPGECQNPGCTREDGYCIGYHCTVCGKPTTSMGHPECHDRAAAGEAGRG